MVERGLPTKVRADIQFLLHRIDTAPISDDEKRRLRALWAELRDDCVKLENMENE